ncbi:hypothetical protein I4U23_022283 [Adineta vaga]|nr:hypothetical protein I4U23_022283 [Adineta vaga]
MITIRERKRLKSHHVINNQPYNQFENLSNDIIIEIFDYLDEHKIRKAFHGLNQRFSQLIDYCPTRSMSLAFIRHDNSKIEQYCNELILSNKSRIRSLKLSDVDLIEKLLSKCVLDESFIRLESISLYDYNLQNSLLQLHKLPIMPRLKVLKIRSNLSKLLSSALDDVYSVILQSSTLMSLTIENSYPSMEKRFLKRLNIGSGQTNIEVFTCFHPIQLSQLQLLLERMPKLRSLKINQVHSDSNSKTELFVTSELRQLTILSIECDSIDLYTAQKLIVGFGATIKYLKLRVSLLKFINDESKWMKFLNENLPQLEKLKIQLPHDADELYGILNDFRKLLLNLLKMSKWNEELWDIIFNILMTEDNIILGFKKKNISTLAASKFTLEMSDTDTEKNIYCHLHDIVKPSFKSPSLHLHITGYNYEVYNLPLITGFLTNLSEITIDSLAGSRSYSLETAAEEDFTHNNVHLMRINCVLCSRRLSLLLKWFPSIQWIEIQLDGYCNELQSREIIHTVIKMIGKKMRLKAIFFIKKKRDETIEWMRETINRENDYSEYDASRMYSIEEKSDSIVLQW